MASKINKRYVDKLKSIRPFVDFNYNINLIKKDQISKYDKAKINKYFRLVEELKATVTYDYRPRRKDHRKAALASRGISGFTELKVVPIVVTNPNEKPKIKFNKKGELITKTLNVNVISLLFNKSKLIKNTDNHIKETINKAPKDFKRFTVMAGVNEITGTWPKGELLEKEIKRLMNQYSVTTKNNYFGNWMYGIKAYQFVNQKNEKDFLNRQKESKDKLKLDRKNARRRTAAKIERDSNK